LGPRAYDEKRVKRTNNQISETKKNVKDILLSTMIEGRQTSGRNEIPFKNRAMIDSNYAKTRSIRQDLLILAKTPKAMFSKW
jgi:lipopolysaccharide/colanic/teichoic acid biosynthesis glycosyltransferase